MCKKQLRVYCCMFLAGLLLSCGGGGGGGVSGESPAAETVYSLTIVPPAAANETNVTCVSESGSNRAEGDGDLYVYVQKYDFLTGKGYGPVKEYPVPEDGRIEVPMEEDQNYLFMLRGKSASGEIWEERKVEYSGRKDAWTQVLFSAGVGIDVNDPSPVISQSIGKADPICVDQPVQLTCHTKLAPLGGTALISSDFSLYEFLGDYAPRPDPDEKVNRNELFTAEGFHVITVTPRAPGRYRYRCRVTDNHTFDGGSYYDHNSSQLMDFYAVNCGSSPAPTPTPTPTGTQISKGDRLACYYSTTWNSYLNGTQVDTEQVAGNYNLVAGDNNSLSGTLYGGVGLNGTNGDLTAYPGYSQAISGTYDNDAQTVSIPDLNINGASMGTLLSGGTTTVAITGSTASGNYTATKNGSTYCTQQQ
jgi:hypothetical protein